MKLKLSVYLFLFLALTGCKKVKYYPDKPFKYNGVKILAHRAGAEGDYRENTLIAAKAGFAALDGIEVDIQISENNTLWLSHDPNLDQCGNLGGSCFENTSDEKILKIDTCIGPNEDYSKLDDILKYMSDNYPQSIISLDVKAWTPCQVTTLNTLAMLNKIGRRIAELAKKYSLQNHILVECETASFLKYVKKISGIECYLSVNGDFERGMMIALEYGLDGVSFKYMYDELITADHVKLLHKKGLKIQVWSVDDPVYIKEAGLIGVDCIQTNDINAKINITAKTAYNN